MFRLWNTRNNFAPCISIELIEFWVLGIARHSIGGVAGTVVDAKQILGVALKCNASALILCHNHPSGNTQPSGSDIELTNNIKKAAKFMNIVLLDHLILTPTDYYSFGDEGMI